MRGNADHNVSWDVLISDENTLRGCHALGTRWYSGMQTQSFIDESVQELDTDQLSLR